MKMNKPYIEIVRFDAEDVIATSGVCAVRPLSEGDRLLHYDHLNNNYFVYDYTKNSNEYVVIGDNTKLRHNNQDTEYTITSEHPESSTNGYSAYIYKDGDWTWWNDDYGSHGNY